MEKNIASEHNPGISDVYSYKYLANSLQAY